MTVVNDDTAMMQLSKFLAHFKSSSSPESTGRQSSQEKQLLQQTGTNNNVSESEDFQVLHSRTGTSSVTSRSGKRSEHVNDDNSSLSAKSDASFDSSTCDHSFGAIRPDLYPRKDIVVQQSSLMTGQGRLHTRLRYDFRTCDLVVHLIEAQDLPSTDPVSGTCGDTYIRVFLLPCVDERLRQSSVRRRTHNPYFNEYFKFPLDFDDLKEKRLLFHFYDSQQRAAVGEVEISIANVDVSNSIEMWCDVQRPYKMISESGEILISLSYLPTAERLTVVVMKARELKLSTSSPSADPFVRVSLMVDGKKVKRKKTSVKRSCSCPVWDEGLAFNVPAEIMPKVTIEVTVLDHDLIGHGEMLGRCLIGEAGEGHGHWKEMLTNQRKSVPTWHVLHK